MFNESDVYNFILESNSIEGILREPTQDEIAEMIRFMNLERITIEELEKFVSVYQPGARLRDEYFLDVRIGDYLPKRGCPEIRTELQQILDRVADKEIRAICDGMGGASYFTHLAYEKLHPFTDGNGRSGRALWAYMRQDVKSLFLVPFYFQALEWGECD